MHDAGKTYLNVVKLQAAPQSPKAEASGLSEDDFVALVRAEYPALIRTAWRYLRCPDAAKDSVQDALIAAFKAKDAFRADGAAEGWLRKTVIRKALDHLRARGRLRSKEQPVDLVAYCNAGLLLEPLYGGAPEPDQILSDRQSEAALRDVIATLPDSYRAPLIMKDLDGFTVKEIAEVLELTESAVKVRLHRARLMLKGALDPDAMGAA
ncbi:MAG: sigma-70 family RNA polymerase sigma factor [Pseudomonadota bacterium]